MLLYPRLPMMDTRKMMHLMDNLRSILLQGAQCSKSMQRHEEVQDTERNAVDIDCDSGVRNILLEYWLVGGICMMFSAIQRVQLV